MRSSRRVSSLTRSGPPSRTSNARVASSAGIGGLGGAACATTRNTMSVRPIVTVESGGERGLGDLARR